VASCTPSTRAVIQLSTCVAVSPISGNGSREKSWCAAISARVASAAIWQSPAYSNPVRPTIPPYPLEQRGIERVIGTLARMNIAGDQVPRGLRGRRHQLQLRQVGTVVLALPSWHHPVVGHLVVALARRPLQAHPCQLELVPRHRRHPQAAFDSVPRLVIAQPIQDAPKRSSLHSTSRIGWPSRCSKVWERPFAQSRTADWR
jgi:hypothetical protein